MKSFTHIVFDHDGTLVDTTKLPKLAFAGIEDLLKFLKEKKVKLYVWTARSSHSAREILTENGLEHYFEGICGGNDAPCKPAPDGIAHLVDDTNPENVVVIGDSIGDIIGGQKFGATAIGAMWGHGNTNAYETFKSYGAFDSFETVKSLEKYLKNNI